MSVGNIYIQEPFARNFMQLPFAHHDMFDALDMLSLNPVTTLEHALAFAIYATLVVVAFLGLRWARRGLSRRIRTARTVSNPSLIMTSRSLEG
jgi:hypothetical protein